VGLLLFYNIKYLSAIRVITFYGKKMSSQLEAKTSLPSPIIMGFKDFLLGKAIISKTDEVVDVESEEGKKNVMIAIWNELNIS
jgi:hypothetical protein